jgi:PAS domain S-box-containing protein
MHYGSMTKAQLIQELVEAHRSIAELEKSASKRKKAEDALHVAEERFRIHFSLSNDIMFSYDTNFIVLSVSPNVERILGYKPEELIGRHFLELSLLEPEDLHEALENALHILSGGIILSSLYQFIANDGTRKFGEISGIPLMRNGKVMEVLAVGRDITERIEMEDTLKKTEETARALLQSSSDSLLLLDTSGKVLALNEIAAENLGKGIRELLQSHVFDHMPKNVAKIRRVYFKQNIDSGKPVRFVDECKGRPFYFSFYPIHDTKGKVARIAVKVKDLSKHKQGTAQ